MNKSCRLEPRRGDFYHQRFSCVSSKTVGSIQRSSTPGVSGVSVLFFKFIIVRVSRLDFVVTARDPFCRSRLPQRIPARYSRESSSCHALGGLTRSWTSTRISSSESCTESTRKRWVAERSKPPCPSPTTTSLPRIDLVVALAAGGGSKDRDRQE